VKPGERKVKKKRKEEEERIEERKGRPGRKEEKIGRKKKEFEIFIQKTGGAEFKILCPRHEKSKNIISGQKSGC
jgi:hypothetical protein